MLVNNGQFPEIRKAVAFLMKEQKLKDKDIAKALNISEAEFQKRIQEDFINCTLADMEKLFNIFDRTFCGFSEKKTKPPIKGFLD